MKWQTWHAALGVELGSVLGELPPPLPAFRETVAHLRKPHPSWQDGMNPWLGCSSMTTRKNESPGWATEACKARKVFTPKVMCVNSAPSKPLEDCSICLCKTCCSELWGQEFSGTWVHSPPLAIKDFQILWAHGTPLYCYGGLSTPRKEKRRKYHQ